MYNKITGKTKLICLLGRPVSHSISPMMHNDSFQALGLDYAYLAFDVSPEEFPHAVLGLKAIGAKGFNLTMPYKTAILPFLDSMTDAARLSGAVNTVKIEDGILTGDTTDGKGYMLSVKNAGHNILGKNMTLLGAGGAATAICVQAALDGVKEIRMFKRKNASWDAAASFAARISSETGSRITLHDIESKEELAASISTSAILTNATNVGMAPTPDACLIPEDMLQSGLIVSDIIYNPGMTKLLEQAKAKGCPYFNGMHMLLYQGAAAFSFWTGKEMPVNLIKERYFTNKGEN